jgi:hypothetical protein
MTNQYLISTFHESIIAAASTGAGNTILVAGIFTIIGATIPLIYQAIFVHNQNRRDDHWSGVNAVADLIAAAHGVLLARSIPTAPSDVNVTKTTSQAGALTDAFFHFDSAYARLVLIIPDLALQLTDLRRKLILAVNSATGDASLERTLEQRIEQRLEDVLNDVRKRLTFPVFKFVHHSKKTAAG